MNHDELDELLKRYSVLYPKEPVPNNEIKDVEEKLGIILPFDLKKITRVYSGGQIGFHSLFTLYDDRGDFNIVNRTLYYRNCDLKLPKRYVALAETEVDFTVLETQPEDKKNTKVIECSIEDAYNLASEKPLLYNPTIFPSFADFFEYLIDQEEEERRVGNEP